MRRTAVLATLVLSVLAGCDSPSAIDNYGLIHTETSAGTLTVSNVGGQPVHYNVLEREDAATILWDQCTPANEGCPTLAPGQAVRIPYVQITQYDEGDTEAIVYWWESRPSGAGGYDIGREGTVIVRLD